MLIFLLIALATRSVDPLAQAKSVPAAIFEREPYIEIHTGLQTDNTLYFRSRGIVPKLSFSTPDSIIACGMVKAGLGVALVNSVIADELRGGVAYVPLDPPENVDICVITPAREVISPAAKSFAAYAMGFISEAVGLDFGAYRWYDSIVDICPR